MIPATNRLPLYSLFVANAISMIGNVLTLVAVPWFVLQTTGSASRTGVTAGVTVLASVLAGFFGGALVDRVGYKQASVLSDLASGLTVALIPLIHLTIGIAFWQLLVLVFLSALLDAPGSTGRQSLLPDLAKAAGMPLERANATYGAIQRGSQFVGPAVAGMLIAVVGVSNVLWFDAATFAVSATLIAMLIPSTTRPHEAAKQAGSYFANLKVGLRFVRDHRLILTMLIAVAITNLLTAPLFSVILPVYADQVFGSAANLGLMLSAFGGGALLGSILYGTVGHRLPRRPTFIGGFLLGALPFGVLALVPGVAVSIAALAIAGIVSGPLNPLIMTVFQEQTPGDMRGRVFGLMSAIAWITMPLGMVVAGLALDVIGLRVTLSALAIGYLIVSASLVLNTALHAMAPDRAPPEVRERDAGHHRAA